MFKGILYIHKNKINGKCYVGQTIQNPKSRWGKDGVSYISQIKFYRAIQKYGWNNFEHIILPTIYDNQEELDEAEKFWIMKLDSIENGYNLRSGGHGGSRLSEDIIKQISEKLKGRKQPIEYVIKRSMSMKGHLVSPETRDKISKALKGKKRTEEQNKANSERGKGRKQSEETKNKKNKKLKGKKRTEEQKQKLRKPKSEAFKKHLSDIKKGKHWYTNNELDGLYFEGEQPEGWFPGQSISRRTACSKAKKGKPNHTQSEETKNKLSAIMKQKLRKKVVVIDTLNNTQIIYKCLADAAKALNYSSSRCHDFKDKNKLLAKRFCIKSVSLKDVAGGNN